MFDDLSSIGFASAEIVCGLTAVSSSSASGSTSSPKNVEADAHKPCCGDRQHKLHYETQKEGSGSVAVAMQRRIATQAGDKLQISTDIIQVSN